jgi:hypothetical protein
MLLGRQRGGQGSRSSATRTFRTALLGSFRVLLPRRAQEMLKKRSLWPAHELTRLGQLFRNTVGRAYSQSRARRGHADEAGSSMKRCG